MAKKKKDINADLVTKELKKIEKDKVDNESLILYDIDEQNNKHFHFHVDRKDVGLNVLNHWNLGYQNSQSIKWIENIITLVNESSNAVVVASNLFTVINNSSPRDAVSYEKQIALAIKILSKINKPVLLWQGKVERDIYKQTGTDVTKLMYKHLKKHKNIHLIEDLDEAKNENDATVFINLHLKTDFVKNAFITLELRDYKTTSRTVKSAENKVKKGAHQRKSDFIIDLAVLQNAKIYPNLLCVGPVCDEEFVKNIKTSDVSLNDSYFKLEVQKCTGKSGYKNPRGYTPIALKCDYCFDNKKEAKLDRINITANTIVEKIDEMEDSVFYEIMKYFASKKEENSLNRHKEIQDILSKEKELSKTKDQKNNSKKKQKTVKDKQEKTEQMEENNELNA